MWGVSMAVAVGIGDGEPCVGPKISFRRRLPIQEAARSVRDRAGARSGSRTPCSAAVERKEPPIFEILQERLQPLAVEGGKAHSNTMVIEPSEHYSIDPFTQCA